MVALMMRLVVGVAFCAAALGKIRRPHSARDIVDGYELDSRLLPIVRALPLVEGAIGVGAFVAGTSRAAGAGAAVLLVAFSGFIARNLRHGRRGDCHCFGTLHSSSLGWRSQLRNGVLLVAATWIALSARQPSLGSGVATLVRHLGEPGVAVTGGLLVVGAGMMLGRRRDRVAAVPAGTDQASAEPASVLPTRVDDGDERVITLGGAPLSLRGDDAPGASAILVFVDPECGPCRSVVPVLRQQWAAASRAGMVVVSSGSVDRTRVFLAGIPEQRVVVDEDFALARRFGVAGTPSAVRVARDSTQADEIVTGSLAIESLLQQAAGPARIARLAWRMLDRVGGTRWHRSRVASVPASPRTGRLLSRRDALAAAGVGTTLALALPLIGGASPAAGATPGTVCPSCGSCTDCDWDSSTGAFSCHPCREACSNGKLCTQYANKNANYLKLQQYLETHGYTQHAAPTAAGLTENGSQSFLALMTTLTSRSPRNPKALLLYQLTNSAEVCTALLLDRQGTATSIVTVSSGGQLILGTVPPPPTGVHTAGDAFAGSGPTMETVSTGPASCEDVCGQAWNLIFLAFKVALATEPIGLGVLLGSYALSSLGGSGQSAATALTIGNATRSATSLANLALRLTLKGTTSKLKSFDGNLMCHAICSVKLEACCNYTGACFNSDAKCESLCPGGLAHPMAHCDVYINGKKVSTLVPGGV